ncbi:MAG: bifunctional phosphopantothenoylcysteine decarboxylase/phosphopantothenate--cysteine ligase CoaBC [Candidatus Bathyarchaeota archaeon]|nr:bifunctional phosphopantothenoylcysteine decarboxylase/phosphopantothenate--cysteine ligase CoaBC [Candidatus Bathyarchaeota archaeon]MDH5733712.1 bifunctional phosphopantothenoylcysteine decarboxylase/phosphopantothenate--cysteine ligase CoaBC [Candidatus Bathyarchaeota archaeon]
MTHHPSKDIVGSKGSELKGKKIVLCITGSVAAVRSSEIARELMRHGAEVFAVMSQMAQKIIHPYLMEWATGNPVVTELTGKIEHVALTGKCKEKADLVLVAPATANTISKIACGIDDTPVTSAVSTAFGSETPITVVPAMHESMYRHPVLIENIKKLESLGVDFIGPRIEEGKAKIAETEEILGAVFHRLEEQKELAGIDVLVTAGPTLEYIDPIRVITNKSSGKMGVAIAEEALARGAQVTLIYGQGTAILPKNAKLISVETTKEMHKAFVSELKSKKYDIVIATAAPADWKLEKPFQRKVPTRTAPKLILKLEPTQKVIKTVKKISPNTLLIPFKAEHNLSDKKLVEKAVKLMKEVGADLVAVNDVGRNGVGFGVDTNEVYIVDKSKAVTHVPLTTKREVAKRLFDLINERIMSRG